MEVSIRENKETIGPGTMKGHNENKCPGNFWGKQESSAAKAQERDLIEKRKTNNRWPKQVWTAQVSYTWNFSQLTTIELTHTVQNHIAQRATPWLGICVCRGLTVIIWGFLIAQVLGTPNPQVIQGSKVLNIFSSIFLWNVTITKIKRRP